MEPMPQSASAEPYQLGAGGMAMPSSSSSWGAMGSRPKINPTTGHPLTPPGYLDSTLSPVSSTDETHLTGWFCASAPSSRSFGRPRRARRCAGGYGARRTNHQSSACFGEEELQRAAVVRVRRGSANVSSTVHHTRSCYGSTVYGVLSKVPTCFATSHRLQGSTRRPSTDALIRISLSLIIHHPSLHWFAHLQHL